LHRPLRRDKILLLFCIFEPRQCRSAFKMRPEALEGEFVDVHDPIKTVVGFVYESSSFHVSIASVPSMISTSWNRRRIAMNKRSRLELKRNSFPK
jgi:hypothetical protein